VVVERLKKLQHQEDLTTNSLQRKTETPKPQNKNPQLLSNWGLLLLIFTALKKWWQKGITLLQQPLAIKLSAFFISFLEFDR
jgi:hypothetical protein